MRPLIVIATMFSMWPTHGFAQERVSIEEHIAKLEQGLFESKSLPGHLGQLLEELDASGEVSRETACLFWKSTLESLFAEQNEISVENQRLVDELVTAQDTPSVDPLRWKIVRANFERRIAAVRYTDVLRARFAVGMENVEALFRAEQEVVDAEVAYYQSLLQTMPSPVEDVADRLLATCRLNAALKAYRSSLTTYKTISQNTGLRLPGASPENEALMRVQVYRRQAQVYELRLALEELQS